MLWVIAESSIPSIKNRAQLASAVNMMFNSTACSAAILWYLERGHTRDKDRARTATAEHARTIEEVADLVYTVAFADGADSERTERQERLEEAGGNLVDLDAHRNTDHGTNGTAARPSSHGSR